MDTPMKRCTRGDKCLNPLGCELSATSEYFYKNKSKKDGFCTECKFCVRAQARNYAKEHPDKVAEGKRLYAKRHPDRRDISCRKWQAKNPDKIRGYRLKAYWNNPDKYRTKARKWYANLPAEQKRIIIRRGVEASRRWRFQHPSDYREYSVIYYRRNKPKLDQRSKDWRIKHPDVMRERNKRYRHKYPEKNRARVRHRNSAKKALPFAFPPEFERRMNEYWDYHCAACGSPAGLWTMLVADHWIPLADARADNPGTVPTNMIPLCHATKGTPVGEASCNVGKHNHDPEQWLVSRFGKRRARAILARINAYFDWVREQDG